MFLILRYVFSVYSRLIRGIRSCHRQDIRGYLHKCLSLSQQHAPQGDPKPREDLRQPELVRCELHILGNIPERAVVIDAARFPTV